MFRLLGLRRYIMLPRHECVRVDTNVTKILYNKRTIKSIYPVILILEEININQELHRTFPAKQERRFSSPFLPLSKVLYGNFYMEVSEVSLCYSYIITSNYVELVILVRIEVVNLRTSAFICPQRAHAATIRCLFRQVPAPQAARLSPPDPPHIPENHSWKARISPCHHRRFCFLSRNFPS